MVVFALGWMRCQPVSRSLGRVANRDGWTSSVREGTLRTELNGCPRFVGANGLDGFRPGWVQLRSCFPLARMRKRIVAGSLPLIGERLKMEGPDRPIDPALLGSCLY